MAFHDPGPDIVITLAGQEHLLTLLIPQKLFFFLTYFLTCLLVYTFYFRQSNGRLGQKCVPVGVHWSVENADCRPELKCRLRLQCNCWKSPNPLEVLMLKVSTSKGVGLFNSYIITLVCILALVSSMQLDWYFEKCIKGRPHDLIIFWEIKGKKSMLQILCSSVLILLCFVKNIVNSLSL